MTPSPYTITCRDRDHSNYIHDLLTNPLSGEGCLSGHKICLKDLEIIPDVMTFELTPEEVIELAQKEGITFNIDDTTVKHKYNKIGQIGRPKIATYNSPSDCISHSMHYCQDYKLIYTDSPEVNGSVAVSLSSIDCSNVDIIVIDSGVDPTHPEFLNSGGSSNVVEFDWTVLLEGDPLAGSQIVTSQSASYYEDLDGHGTSCASLAAGNRCGFAKKAKIYSLRGNSLGNTSDGFDEEECVRLAIAFQQAKSIGLHGLDSTRPTICTNSWGPTGPLILTETNGMSPTAISNNQAFAVCFDGGNNTQWWNEMQGRNDTYDGLMRQLLDLGVHVLAAAGNENTYLTNPSSAANFHVFYGIDYDENYVMPRTSDNDSYALLNLYSDPFQDYVYLGTAVRYPFYGSLNVGRGYSKTTWPIIRVGDLVPVGENENDADLYFSGAEPETSRRILAANSSESRITLNFGMRYTSTEGPFFTKSTYSNFGPDVDIYAPGNGAWSARSNQNTEAKTEPIIVPDPADLTGEYCFFNGTSSATPIVAGILATYLAEFPNKTPAQAKQWLLSNGIKNNIMETQKNELLSVSYDGLTTTDIYAPFGADVVSLQTNSMYRLQRNVTDPSFFDTGNIEDFLFCHRFFDSSNIIAQAYPLRKAVVEQLIPTATITVNDTTLNNNTVTTQRITH